MQIAPYVFVLPVLHQQELGNIRPEEQTRGLLNYFKDLASLFDRTVLN